MEYRDERLDKLVGTPMMIELLEGPDPTPEDVDKMAEEPGWGIHKSTVGSRTALYRLLGYDAVGVTIKTLQEGSTNVFVPWGAALGIYGTTDEDEA